MVVRARMCVGWLTGGGVDIPQSSKHAQDAQDARRAPRRCAGGGLRAPRGSDGHTVSNQQFAEV